MTIEERAKQYTGNVMYEACFIDGAYDQRQIEIEKACEWLNEILYKFVPTTINGICEELTKEEFIKAFRKTMEDEQ